MEEIIPGLWIGDLACALATDYLSLAGVTHIVTAMKQSLPSPIQLSDGKRIEDAQMYHVSLDDLDNSPILVHLPGAVDFIDEAIEQRWIDDDDDDDTDNNIRQGSVSNNLDEQDYQTPPEGRRKGQWGTMGSGTVLVHCQAGISRSVAIVAAYLMKIRSMSLASALELIQSRRSQADPNPGFRMQLELYGSAGCNVDVRNQRIRRYLMSHSSILKGDPIDDVLLSYYPSPFHSPAGSSAGSVNNGIQTSANLQFSTLDEGIEAGEGSCTRSNKSESLSSSTSVSPNMSRQGSRAATAAAAADRGAQRQQRSSKGNGTSKLDLSKSPPMPPNASDLFDNIDEAQEQDESSSKRLIKEQFSSVREDHEVLITISKGKLPGGVKSVKGNQGKANGDIRLPKPHFRGLKLRCKMCRSELAARDHVVEHEAGRGKDAFDVRKREKDTDAKNKDARLVKELGIEERSGAQKRLQSHTVEDGKDTIEENSAVQQGDDLVEQQIPSSNQNTIQTAASLSAQLPPHLAALRQGRAGQTASQSPSRDTAAIPQQQRRMLHSSQCSSYFVEPLAWMSALKMGQVAGRLDCPNGRCGAKLGSWDWAGMQCACGAWVTPAFALHKSKVDEI